MRKGQKPTKEEEKPPVPTFLGESQVEMNEEELEELAADEDAEDIFIDVGEKLYKTGDRVTYTIKKDGAFYKGGVKHPYSWEKLQRDSGGGTYQIIARSSKAGGFIKSQTRLIAEMDEPETDETENKSSNSTVELLALLQAQKKEEREEMIRSEERRESERREREEKAERDRKEQAKAMQESSNQTTLMMMKMMESSSAQTTALLTALLGNKKEPEFNVEKIMTMMDARMEKIVAMVQGKDKTKDIDALKLIELTGQAEDRGYKKAMDIQKQAEAKAEEIAELRDNAIHPPREEGSTTKALIEAVMPALSAFAQARGMAPPSVPATPAQVPAIKTVPGVNPHKPAIPYQARQVIGQRLPIKTPAGAPKTATPPPAAQKKEPEMTKNERTEKVVIDEIGKDLSANMLSQKFNPEKTAEKVLTILKPFGIDPQWLCSAYNLDAMLGIAKAKGLPDLIKPYIERFHAYIESKTAVGSRVGSQSS